VPFFFSSRADSLIIAKYSSRKGGLS